MDRLTVKCLISLVDNLTKEDEELFMKEIRQDIYHIKSDDYINAYVRAKSEEDLINKVYTKKRIRDIYYIYHHIWSMITYENVYPIYHVCGMCNTGVKTRIKLRKCQNCGVKDKHSSLTEEEWYTLIKNTLFDHPYIKIEKISLLE